MQTNDPNLTKTPVDKKATAVETDVDNQVVDSQAKAESTENKGTDTLTNDNVDSEHVKQGDNAARQPDRRDQQGSTPFDGNVNQDTISKDGSSVATGNVNANETTEEPQSDEINDQNRYATLDNAQTRVLNEDLK